MIIFFFFLWKKWPKTTFLTYRYMLYRLNTCKLRYKDKLTFHIDCVHVCKQTVNILLLQASFNALWVDAPIYVLRLAWTCRVVTLWDFVDITLWCCGPLYLCLPCSWDNGETERLSPWDMEPVDQNRKNSFLYGILFFFSQQTLVYRYLKSAFMIFLIVLKSQRGEERYHWIG